MQKVHGRIDGPLHVTADLTMVGTIRGGVVVHRGAHFVLRGECRGSVEVEREGRAELWGIVDGDIDNHGVVSVFGLVRGAVAGEGATHLVCDSRAEGGRGSG